MRGAAMHSGYFRNDVPKGILQNILHLDSQTILNGLGWDGWPSIYEPKEEICALCGVSLSSARPHPGQKTGDGGYLITNAVEPSAKLHSTLRISVN